MSAPKLRETHGWLASCAVPLWLVGLLCLTSAGGCRGCSRSSQPLSREEIEKRAKEEKEAIETKQPLLALPADAEVKTIAAKPGHWIETVRTVKSNREDLQIIATGDVLRGREKVLNIPGTSVTAEFARPTVLPKGQTKTIDLEYYVPTTSVAVDQFNPVSTALNLRFSLLSKSLLTPLLQEPFSVYEMKHPEFLLVVVSPKPLDYAFLSASDLVIWRGGNLMLEDRPRSYHVILCGSEKGKLPFPTSMLTMTSTAVIVWDDLAPDDLSEDQKTALVDWLHWGGQLVVSGPGSWSRLQNSFLMPYLPIRSGMATELTTEDFTPLNHWVVPDVTGQPAEPLQIVGSKVPGLAMQLSNQGQWLPEAGELVAERYVGRGRVVVTGFPIREQRLYRWKYYPSLLSTGLLRRPARAAQQVQGSFAQVWDGAFSNMERDPRLNTQLRIASRDMPLSRRSSQEAAEFATRSEQEIRERATLNDRDITPEKRQAVDIRRFSERDYEAVQWSPNGAAWSDTSGFAFSALSALRNAAGIVLPDRWTIIYLIGGYLAVLVPLNWLVFRLIGRLELAWVAAPFIALLGVVVVTKVARLDIGFARRTTEIGLLELHGDYQRGHLTNYAALYTSLSTNYAIEYPDRGSVALPLGDISRRQLRAGNTSAKIQAKYGTSAGIRLEPVTVYSNSTEMLHSEEMVGLPGGILFATEEDRPVSASVKNTTGIALKSCCLVRRGDDGVFQYAWLGDLAEDASRKADWVEADINAPWDHWNKSIITRRPESGEVPVASDETQTDASGLLVGGLLNELLTAVPLVPGQVRLLAYTDQRPGKMVVEPVDDQLDSRTVVMAHLRPANWRPITPDTSIIGRVPGGAEPSGFDIDAPPPDGQ
ncbi:MAG: hypothetical protein ACTHK7_15235 [Aureliella sp.]